jgi:hypothetical protein
MDNEEETRELEPEARKRGRVWDVNACVIE